MENITLNSYTTISQLDSITTLNPADMFIVSKVDKNTTATIYKNTSIAFEILKNIIENALSSRYASINDVESGYVSKDSANAELTVDSGKCITGIKQVNGQIIAVSSSNNIDITSKLTGYLKKSDADISYVSLLTDQAIASQKTFNKPIVVSCENTPTDTYIALSSNAYYGGLYSNTGKLIGIDLTNQVTFASTPDSTKSTNQIATLKYVNDSVIQLSNDIISQITSLRNDLTADIKTKFDSVYPVNSIFITLNNSGICEMQNIIPDSTWQLIDSGYVLQQAKDQEQVGTKITAGLPNITGMCGVGFPSGKPAQQSTQINGAFYLKPFATGIGVADAGTSKNDPLIAFDASRGETTTSSTKIYGNSDTVQPKALCVYFWKRTS